MVKFFSKEQEQEIIKAIRAVEKKTSGEIRVHLQKKCKGDVMEKAKEVFFKLKMHETALRNGVIFFVVPRDHKFALLGDAGLDEVVPDTFWEQTKEELKAYFKRQEFTEGLVYGIQKVGDYLATYFPYQQDDENELPDEISYDEE